ncbi:mechanosensitive ion channel family protein, partial [Sulfitobacter sp. HI0023]|uniref:mechanosensitive ion channel family protein n=1 Tax=Sulfitobacter sp. HI0023 TaxID=1822225 RepID=UPI003FCE6784
MRVEEVEANPGLIFDKLDAWLDGLFRLLPNIAIAIVVLILFYFLGRYFGGVARRAAKR